MSEHLREQTHRVAILIATKVSPAPMKFELGLKPGLGAAILEKIDEVREKHKNTIAKETFAKGYEAGVKYHDETFLPDMEREIVKILVEHLIVSGETPDLKSVILNEEPAVGA